MLPQTCEEAHLFYEDLVAYAAARSARQGSERVLLKAMNARHADIIAKLFQNTPEDHAEVEEYFCECIRLVMAERPGAQAVLSLGSLDGLGVLTAKKLKHSDFRS